MSSQEPQAALSERSSGMSFSTEEGEQAYAFIPYTVLILTWLGLGVKITESLRLQRTFKSQSNHHD